MRFKGKTAVVTGAGAGLGKAIALGLGREGAGTVFLLDMNEAALAAAQAEIGNPGIPLVCDVSSEESTALAWRKIASFSPSIDILVTSAGILGPTGSPRRLRCRRLGQALCRQCQRDVSGSSTGSADDAQCRQRGHRHDRLHRRTGRIGDAGVL